MQFLVMGLISAMYLIDLGVTLLNERHSRQPLPLHAQGIYDDATYTKWLDYALLTSRHTLIAKTVKTVLFLGLLGSGAFGVLERWSNARFIHPLSQTLAFLGGFASLDLLVSLPFDYYKVFVIEEKFGLNTTTRRTFWLDTLKQGLLTVALGGGIVSVLYTLFTLFSNCWGVFVMLAWVVLAALNVLLFVLNTKVFIRLFYKLTPFPEGELRNAIAALANQAGFDVCSISVMNASQRSTRLNAFLGGLGKTREVVLFDTLLEKLKPNEILAVLAHEFGHAQHRDALRVLGLQIAWLGVYAGLLGFILQRPLPVQAFGLTGLHFGFGLVLFNILAEPLDLLISLPVNAINRRLEYAADAFASRLTDAASLISALRSIAQENLANLNPHPLYVLLHERHPTVPERLRALAGGR